jgi:TonB family protein
MRGIPLAIAGVAICAAQEPSTPEHSAEKNSSWHLSGISYKSPAGASDPLLVSEKYPPNTGPGTRASITLSFDVDEQGVPVNLHVEKSSDQKRDEEVIAAVLEWRFNPGLLDFKPVLVPCTVSLVLGEACRCCRPSAD